MKGLHRILIVAALAVVMLATSASLAAAAPIVADEFTSGPLNTGIWRTNLPWGTQYNSNHELEWYDPANISFLSGGMRFKTERRTARTGYPYTSAVTTSRTQYSYGYYEIRAKLPKGRGVWPAIWLLRDGTHEIDIMEMLGHEPNKMYMTYHRNGGQVYQARYTLPSGDFSQAYHTFAVDWQPTYIRWYVDGVQRGQYTGTILSTPQNIVMNTAVGGTGSWPGPPDSTTVFPQYMDIDFVRVYRTKPAATPAPAPTPAPTPPPGVTFSRLAGSDRYTTSVAVSKKSFPSAAPAAVVAYGGDFPDALAAAPLARAYGGPVLLTTTAGLPASVRDELVRLAPKRVFVVGSPRVVGTAVEAQLASLPSKPAVTRLAGSDRYGTAAAIADALRAVRGTPSRVMLVNSYADALSAAPLAARRGWPILLTTRDSLPSVTYYAIRRSGAPASFVIGSSAVISDRVAAALPAATRVGGADRYATSALVADLAAREGSTYMHLAFATGANFPDGLVSAPYVAGYSGQLLLTRPSDIPSAIAQRIGANKSLTDALCAIGSTAALSDSVLVQAASLLR